MLSTMSFKTAVQLELQSLI